MEQNKTKTDAKAEKHVEHEHDHHEAAAPAKDKHEGLVKVKKDDEVIHVHPSTVAKHEELGWARV